MSKRSWRRLFISRRAAWQSLKTNLNKTALDQFSDAVAHSERPVGLRQAGTKLEAHSRPRKVR